MTLAISLLALTLAVYAIADRKLEQRESVRRIIKALTAPPSPVLIERMAETLRRLAPE